MQISRHIYDGAKSAERGRQRIARTGHVGGKQLWKPEEDRVLSALYPNYEAARKALPGRTYYSLRYRARTLHIQKKRQSWTGADVVRMRKLYPVATMADLLAAFPGRTPETIKSFAVSMHIRKRFEFKKTGYPVIDAIRVRCKELGYSMGDLDEIARTKRYFTSALWLSNKSVRGSAVYKAVEALDGTLLVSWRDMSDEQPARRTK
jgi:hypothetical protein